MRSASSRIMADGKRLHLQHGPIDIVAQSFGSNEEIQRSYDQGILFFNNVLSEIVKDLDAVRQPVNLDEKPHLKGITGDMEIAARLFAKNRFVTPMAAVAGVVADHVKAAMVEGRNLDKLYVNNGGDISLHLRGNATFISGIVNNQDAPAVDAKASIAAGEGIGGLATSGWRGRSMSPGIADAVTILAETAAMADVAATLIAGDVFTESAAIQQEKASELRDDTDLGDMLITTDVGSLTASQIDDALSRGLETAAKFQDQGLIRGAYLALQGEVKNLAVTKIIQGRKVA